MSEAMTKDEIAKLPTPETDALVRSNPDNCGLHEMAEAFNRMLDHAQTIERKLAAAVMDLEKARDTFNDFNRGLRILGKTVIADAAQIAHDSIDETLAAIRGSD